MIETNSARGVDRFPVDETYKGVRVQDEAYDEKRVMIEVDVAPANGAMVARQHVRQGVHRLVVYESDLPAIERRVQSDADRAGWAAAEAAHEVRFGMFMCERLGLKGVQPEKAAETWRAAIAKDAGLARKAEILKDVYSGAPALEFVRTNPLRKTGIPPLRRMEVIDRNVPKPDTPTTRVERTEATHAALLERLVQAVEGRRGGGDHRKG